MIEIVVFIIMSIIVVCILMSIGVGLAMLLAIPGALFAGLVELFTKEK